MAIKIEMLRCFVTVARTGTLGDAAAILGRTPSALSMTLKQLEAQLGEPLFETERKSKLTALGAFVFDQAERELKQFDATVAAISEFATSKQGRVRVAAVPSVAGTILPMAISRFVDDFPGVKVELRDMDSPSVLNEVGAGNADIGIASAAGHPNALVQRELLSDRFGVVCRADSALAHTSGPVSWAEIADSSFIANGLSAQIDDPASLSLHERATLSAHNNTSLVAMVKAALGVTILPETAMQMQGTDGVVFRPLADSTLRRHLQLLRKGERPSSPAAGRLEDWIVRIAGSWT